MNAARSLAALPVRAWDVSCATLGCLVNVKALLSSVPLPPSVLKFDAIL